MRTRRAYTLLEVVLVMAMLLIVLSLAVPFAATWFSGQKATAASDLVRAKLTEARMLAQKEGRAYRFAMKENTGYYRIAPEGAEYWDSVAEEDWLQLNDVRMLAAVGMEAEGMQGVTFLPNGAARQSVRLGISNAQGQSSVYLQIRAETGTVTEEVEGSGQ